MKEPQKKFVLSFAEIVVIIFIFIAGFCVFTARTFDVSQESNIIYKWKKVLDSAKYSYNVVLLTESDNLNNAMLLNDTDRNKAVFKLSAKTISLEENKKLRKYKYRFLNGTKVPENSKYYVKDFMISPKGTTVIGLNWQNPKCFENNELCGIMIFDMNGRRGPNRFGLDVFGVNIYNDRLEPFGSNLNYTESEKNCSRLQTGVTCSQFYLIGGQFFK